MDERSLKDKILYNKLSWLIPFHPLIAWGDTIMDLNKFYKRPEINLTDSKEDLIKKNDMSKDLYNIKDYKFLNRDIEEIKNNPELYQKYLELNEGL